MKLVDVFTFYNELDLLEYRFTVLDPVVDWFVLVEATLTHAGHPKPLFFKENQDRFSKWIHKIVHIVVADMPNTQDTWVRERFQRVAVNRGLQQLEIRSADIIIVSDLDEIPNPNAIARCREEGIDGFACLEMDLYYYSITSQCPKKWYHAKVCSYDTYVNVFHRDPNTLRLTTSETVVQNGGWHLSYFGSPEFIQNKLRNFAHQEFNTKKHTSLEFLRERVAKHTNLFDTRVFVMTPLESNPFPPPHLDVLLRFFPI